MLRFLRETTTGYDHIAVEIENLIVAGWTGRDPAAIAHHIEELAAIGVSPPSRVPLFYRISTSQLTQTTRLQVLGPDSSGEVEPVLVSLVDGLWVGIGSDHTDRKAEAMGVALSKQLCGKIVGEALWRFADVAPHWDRLILRSWAVFGSERCLYQEGFAAAIRPPAELLRLYLGGDGDLPAATLMYCGTLGAKGGVRAADRFEMELEDPVLGRKLAHAYDVKELPVVS